MEIHAFGPLVKNKALQIVRDNISAMANINHMGGQRHLSTLITKALDITSWLWYSVYSAGGETTPVFFVYKKTVILLV